MQFFGVTSLSVIEILVKLNIFRELHFKIKIYIFCAFYMIFINVLWNKDSV